MSSPISAASEVVSAHTREQQRLLEEQPQGGASVAARGAAAEVHRSLAADAWSSLRSNWVFWFASFFILIFVVMAAFPGLFTHVQPNANADLLKSAEPPSRHAIFGYDLQGHSVYARTIYGARASILVGIMTALVALLIGGLLGGVAGYYGGWVDAVISRVNDIFFAIPLLLGAIIILFSFPNTADTPVLLAILKVALAIAALSWSSTARLMRASVIQIKQADYVTAARALGAGNLRIMWRHVLPNALTPIIVVTTISLGAYIGAEAALSYLGIGLNGTAAVSWGQDINTAQTFIRTSPHELFFPCVFLTFAVLSFIMLGDAVREALDPKLK